MHHQLNTALNLETFIDIVRKRASVTLHPDALTRVAQGRAQVEQLVAEQRVVYGVTTGFGKFASVRIATHEIQELQRNLLLSHAIGVGEPLPTEVVRGMMVLRAQSLAQGYSGVRPQIIERLLTLLNAGIHPVVPSQGSVGASGDLAPLAHMCLPLIGEGEVEYQGQRSLPAPGTGSHMRLDPQRFPDPKC